MCGTLFCVYVPVVLCFVYMYMYVLCSSNSGPSWWCNGWLSNFECDRLWVQSLSKSNSARVFAVSPKIPDLPLNNNH